MMNLSNSQRKIMDAAKEIFVKKGYEGTTLNAIAEKVGIRKASFYAHFNHKEALFYRMFEIVLEEHQSKIEEIFENLNGESAKRKLYEIFVRYLDYCYTNQNMRLWENFYYFPPETMESYIKSKTHNAEKWIEAKIIEIVEEGISKKEIKNLASNDIKNVFYHLMLGYALSATAYAARDISSELNRNFSIFWDGIKNKQEEYHYE